MLERGVGGGKSVYRAAAGEEYRANGRHAPAAQRAAHSASRWLAAISIRATEE